MPWKSYSKWQPWQPEQEAESSHPNHKQEEEQRPLEAGEALHSQSPHSDILPSARPHFLNFLKQHHPLGPMLKHLSLWETFLIPTTTDVVNELSFCNL